MADLLPDENKLALNTELEIEAPPAAVWQVLTDLEAYRSWNPFIAEASGTLEQGAQLTIELTPSMGKPIRFRPTVLSADEPRELRWRGRMLWRMVSAEHYFTLTETPSGGTRLAHGQRLEGAMMRAFLERLTYVFRGFVMMNNALKARVESAP